MAKLILLYTFIGTQALKLKTAVIKIPWEKNMYFNKWQYIDIDLLFLLLNMCDIYLKISRAILYQIYKI